MRTRTLQELFVLLVIIAVAVLVFWQTEQFSTASGGQISPGTFPRMIAGTMAFLALVKALVLMLQANRGSLPDGPMWNRQTLIKPAGATVLMILYVFLFGKLPFLPLTAAFVVLAFLVFGVRPWNRLLIGATVATVFLYVLFSRLLVIAV